MSPSVLMHRLKTTAYAIVTIVLAGWVTDALNEELIFKPMLRYFFPQAMESYLHPFHSRTDFLIWSVPLLLGLSIMLVTSIMTVHQIKKRHIYRLGRQVAHPALARLVAWMPDAASVPGFVQSLTGLPLQSIDFLCTDKNELEHLKNHPLLAKIPISAHEVSLSHDIHALYLQLNKIAQKIMKNPGSEGTTGLYMHQLPPGLASAATLVCLENSISLCYPDQNQRLKSHDIIFEMDSAS